MADLFALASDNVDQFRGWSQATALTEELNSMRMMLSEACPSGAKITFDFDGRLHVHVDVRSREDIATVERVLPTLGQGLFHILRRGDAPRHRFLHRISALVAS